MQRPNDDSLTNYSLITNLCLAGSSPKKQIEDIFEIIGMPDDDSWPGIKVDLETCSLSIPNYPGRDLKLLAPRLDELGIDLLSRFLECNPKSRITANEAMMHSYFNVLPPQVHSLPDHMSIFSIASIEIVPEIPCKQLWQGVENVTV